MKNLKSILFVACCMFLVFSCKNEKQPEVKTVENTIKNVKEALDPNASYATSQFTIEGMTCAMGCAKTIEKKMAAMEGVKSAKVDFERKLAMVEYDKAKVTPLSLEEVVKKAGETYKVADMKTVEGLAKKASCSKDGKSCSVKCSPDCTKKDCEKCTAKTAACKKKCDAKKASCSKNGKSCSVKCSPDCTKKDCEKCATKTAACKKNCAAKKGCDKGCEKACCANKKE